MEAFLPAINFIGSVLCGLCVIGSAISLIAADWSDALFFGGLAAFLAVVVML